MQFQLAFLPPFSSILIQPFSLITGSIDFYDSGFYKIELEDGSPATGSVIAMKRKSYHYKAFAINELRLYQTPNLIQELAESQAVSITASPHTDQDYLATNLISNFANRRGRAKRPQKDDATENLDG